MIKTPYRASGGCWHRMLFLPGMLALAGCASAPATSSSQASTCEAGAAQWALGQSISDSLANRIQLDTRATRVERIRPGQPVNADIRPDRINIKLDQDGRIQSITCG